MLKRCPRCGEEKPTAAFNRRKSRPDGLQIQCRTCCQEQSRQTYRNNPTPYKNRAAVRKAQVRAHLAAFVDEYRRTHACQFCGETDECVLDFHHVLPGAPVTKQLYSITALARELAKCVLVCANCHRRLHAGKLVAAEKDLIQPSVPPIPRRP